MWKTIEQSLRIVAAELESLLPRVADRILKMMKTLGNPANWFRADPVTPWRSVAFSESLNFVDDMQNLLGGWAVRIPGLLIATIALEGLQLPPHLRQHVMTLDDVAKFPIKVALDYGIREISSGSIPYSLSVTDRMTKLSKLWGAVRSTNPFSKVIRALFGSLWGRILKLLLLLWQAAQLWGVAFFVYRYAKILETSERPEETIFSSKLTQKHPRKFEREKIRRRIGGVKP